MHLNVNRITAVGCTGIAEKETSLKERERDSNSIEDLKNEIQ